METFSELLALCAGNSPVSGEFPAQRPVTRSFDVFFHLRPNKRYSITMSKETIQSHMSGMIIWAYQPYVKICIDSPSLHIWVDLHNQWDNMPMLYKVSFGIYEWACISIFKTLYINEHQCLFWRVREGIYVGHVTDNVLGEAAPLLLDNCVKTPTIIGGNNNLYLNSWNTWKS